MLKEVIKKLIKKYHKNKRYTNKKKRLTNKKKKKKKYKEK